jgi:hypothetical protein
MERRNQLFLLIIVALAILGFGLWMLFQPFLSKYVEQPPALPEQVTPGGTVPGTGVKTDVETPPVIAPDIKELSDRAAVFAERLGSGSSQDGFTGYDDVMLGATPAFREILNAQRQELVRLHPATGLPYGLITRVVSVDNKQAVSGAGIIPFILQVQEAEDAGNPAKPSRVSYSEWTLSFEKQSDGSYLVAGLSKRPLEF